MFIFTLIFIHLVWGITVFIFHGVNLIILKGLLLKILKNSQKSKKIQSGKTKIFLDSFITDKRENVKKAKNICENKRVSTLRIWKK